MVDEYYGYVYKILVPVHGQHMFYIGQKKSSKIVRTYFGSGVKINSWFKKHTKHNSKWCPQKIAESAGIQREILCWCTTSEELSEKEIFYINEQRKQNNCLNIADGGENGWSKESHKKSVETRKKNGSYIMSKERIDKLHEGRRNTPVSEQYKKKLSDRMSGAKNCMSRENGGHTARWRKLHSEQMKGHAPTNFRKIKCLDTGEIFDSAAAAAKWVGCTAALISMACKKKVSNRGFVTDTAKGYKFCYVQGA